MRESMGKYRGKTVHNNEWIYGNYLQQEYCDGKGRCHFIKIDGRTPIEVIPETVGQFTGLTDKNGKDIFEGDLVKLDNFKPSIYIVAFIEGAFCFITGDDDFMPIDINFYESSTGNHSEIVGTIHKEK